jgi:ferredoxin-type protein NapG
VNDRADSELSQQGRRRFLTDLARSVSAVGIVGLGLGLYSRQSRSLPATAIRPPGVNDELAFQSACIRCGLCVRDCPYDTLKLAQPGDDVPLGTPWFEARQIPCEMCEDIPCVKACPTGALDPALADIDDARMGLAVLIDQENCIAFRGLRCEVCYNICPVRGKAITLDRRHNKRTGKHALIIPVVHSEACTGCGKCEAACVVEKATIKVLPFHIAQGEMGDFYRLGWIEKQKAGGSLVTPDPEHRYTLPPGQSYDFERRGLIQESSDDATPFDGNALDRLNGGFK